MHYISEKSLQFALKIIKNGAYKAISSVPSIKVKLISTEAAKDFDVELQLGLN